MRWDGQKDGAAPQQALPGLPGVVRSVRTPEFADVVFHEVHAKSVLNKVPGSSPMPFKWTVNPYRGCSHGCTYCLAGDTPILLADGRTKPLVDVEVGDEVCGTKDGRYVRTTVLAHWRTVKLAYRVVLEDGTELVTSGDHRFLSTDGWKHVSAGRCERPRLAVGDRLVGVGGFAAGPEETPDYRNGYLWGVVRGGLTTEPEALDRAERYAEADRDRVEWPVAPRDDWTKGFLAGVFDAAGRCEDGVLRIRTDHPIVDAVVLGLKRLDFDCTVEDGVTRLRGGAAEALRFCHTTDPARSSARTITGAHLETAIGVVAIKALGEDRTLFDITTGTGDFVANGVVSHNCFARNSHTYLDLDAGHDFDSQVVVKVNAVQVLTRQLRSTRWQREHVAMGTNTDPYQRAEGRYRLMPGIIKALADSGTPFSILTKGTILARDLPLLAEAAKSVPVGVGVSLALLDRDLQHSLEPGTPSPQARLDLIRRVRDAGLPCGVFVAPVLPALTDSKEHLDALLGQIAAAGATGVTALALHLRPGTREWFAHWLLREHPDLLDGYRNLYGTGSYADKRYRTWLTARLKPLLRKHGLTPKPHRDPTGIPGDDNGRWPDGALPANIPTQRGIDRDQLTLL
ncbi:intein-containing Rv2578c family radical SAM protein [Umezawaea tangerina]|uniref:Intein/intein n=1 Tax=Umezawaea tangerina TaxID=84725 RepID=A0A2T0T555_9PSEU|nr:intein-containing Rv2578c family radical SAM protein [Umezawaea tangerina]PRY40815.1 intein/intein [Umezawaea tangerina]